MLALSIATQSTNDQSDMYEVLPLHHYTTPSHSSSGPIYHEFQEYLDLIDLHSSQSVQANYAPTAAPTASVQVDSTTTWIPGSLLSIQSTFQINQLPQQLHEQFFFRLESQSTTQGSFQFKIDTSVFTNSTFAYFYATFGDDNCRSSNCQYPGTLFKFPIPSMSNSFSITNFDLRLAWASLRKQYPSWEQQQQQFPNTILFDMIIPLDENFIPSISTRQPIFSWELTIPTATPDNIAIRTGPLTRASPEMTKYTKYQLKLDNLGVIKGSSEPTPQDFQVDLVLPYKGAISTSARPNIALYSLTSVSRLWYRSSSEGCKLSGSSSIQSFFWDVLFKDKNKNPVIEISRVWTYDTWPRRLNIDCKKVAVTSLPGKLYYVPYHNSTSYDLTPTRFDYSETDWALADSKTGKISKQPLFNKAGQTSDLFIEDSLIHRTHKLLGASVSDAAYPLEASTRVSAKGPEDLSVGQIVGIVFGSIGGVIAAIILVVILCCCCQSSQARKNRNQLAMSYNNPNNGITVTITSPPLVPNTQYSPPCPVSQNTNTAYQQQYNHQQPTYQPYPQHQPYQPHQSQSPTMFQSDQYRPQQSQQSYQPLYSQQSYQPATTYPTGGSTGPNTNSHPNQQLVDKEEKPPSYGEM